MIPPFGRVRGVARDLERVQDNVGNTLDAILRVPLLDGNLLEGELLRGILIAATPTVTLVDHKLNRTVRGWWLTDKNANADVWQSTTANAIPDLKLRLIASAAVTVDIWVF